MFSKKFKNIIFVILILVFASAIALFNYNNSIYNFNHKDSFFDIFDIEKKYIPIYIDNSSYIKNENLILGGSETSTLFGINENQRLFNLITSKTADYRIFYEMLKYYLDLHPETKKIYFFICYPSFLNFRKNDFVIEKNRNLIFDKIKILLSVDAFKKIINDKLWNLENQNGRRYYPFNSDFIQGKTSDYKKSTEKNFIYSIKILDLLKEKNIDSEFIIPPYNAVYLSVLYLKSDNYKLLEKIKRFFVNNYGPVYDFAVINKYSNQNMLDNTQYMFYCPDHANEYYGRKLLRTILFEREYGEDYLYIKHTKENIEDNLLKQRKDIEKYIDDNKEYYNYYLKNIQDKGDIKNPGGYYRILKDEIIPDEAWEDRQYIEERTEKIKNEDE